ncbi:MAG: hypothetical protein ACI9LO_003548 [Planctomycetota bacterium]|jgi:hypothetical protein
MDNFDGVVGIVGSVKTTIKCDDASLMTIANSPLMQSAVPIAGKKK